MNELISKDKHQARLTCTCGEFIGGALVAGAKYLVEDFENHVKRHTDSH